MSHAVPSLTDGVIDSLPSLGVDVLYFPESDAQQRDVVLTVRPITEALTGYYSCVSQESGVSAQVYTTLTNPVWELTTSNENYLPVGTSLPVVSARYADFSPGYINFGQGFSYSLIYYAASEIPMSQNQSSTSEPERPLEPFSTDGSVLITGRTSNLVGNNVTYFIIGQLNDFDGQYQFNGKHITVWCPCVYMYIYI